MSAFASDQSIDELYIAQYLAMAALQTPRHDVSRFTVGRTATVHPDNVVVSVVSAFLCTRRGRVLTVKR